MGAESLNPYVAGAQALGGIIKSVVGFGQASKGNRLLKGLVYPTETIPTEITDAAATGLPSEQYNQAMKNIQRNQLVALRGSQDRRSGVALISNIQQGTNDATLNLDAKNAEARQSNQFRLASWKDKVWQHNVRDKYNRDYDYAMKLKGMGNQNLYGGVDQIAGGAALGASGGLFGGGGGKNNTPSYSGYI